MKEQYYFIKQWVKAPLQTGAVVPSSQKLAHAMVAKVKGDPELPIIELGPGTGVVTQAILDAGIQAEKLHSIEFNSNFAQKLQRRFTDINVIEGDAYDLNNVLVKHGIDKVRAIISSLPLFTQPVEKRRSLLDQCVKLMPSGEPFIQFSYAFVPAFHGAKQRYRIETSNWIWFNIPPARVWTYHNKNT